MLSFDNTEIAFANKDNKGLNKAYWVFKLIENRWLNQVGTSLLQLALRLRLPVKSIIKITVFNHFCGGESIEDCEDRIQELAAYNVKTILDYSVEGKQSEEDFEHALKNALESVQRAAKDQFVPFCVIKLTGLIPFDLLEKVSGKTALDAQEEKTFLRGKDRVHQVAKAAFDADIPLMIDAEESWIQDAIDDIAWEMMQAFNRQRAIIYNTAQMYRHDRLAYIKDLFQLAEKEGIFIGLKVVRGAYMEKERERAVEHHYPSPIQADKAATDSDFDAALLFCVEHRSRIALCCGSHNEKSSLMLAQLMKEKSIPADDPHIYFSQLLGMSDHISYNLSQHNYNVAKYVPYGPVKDVMPYLIRRAQENSSIAGQTGRELSLIIKEQKRRKQATA